MSRCLKCFHEFKSGALVPQLCPQCGCDLRDDQERLQWRPIANISNMSEVGFLADLLHAKDIPTDIQQHDEFSAEAGGWKSMFVLRVEQSQAVAAVDLLKQEMAREVGNTQTDRDITASPSDSAPLRSSKISFVTILIIASLAYSFWRGAAFIPQQTPGPNHDLWNSLTESNEPLRTSATVGKPFRQLRFDPLLERLLLEEDFDGDGNIDLTRQFTAPP